MIVPQASVEANRIAGKPEIFPPQDNIRAMQKRRRGTYCVVELCLDDKGAPSRIQILHSSGYGGYDLTIRDGAAGELQAPRA